jgi:hypothetical protein
MDRRDHRRRFVIARGWCRASILVTAILGATSAVRPAQAACPCGKTWPHLICHKHVLGHAVGPGDIVDADTGGSWYWMRSPEQERRVAMNLYNRYCIRCHSVDGRGVWDIPDVPDFANVVWQNTRPDDYRSRVILEGRGAVMPAFRGILTVEESCALARYLHTFLPGNEVSRPGLRPADAPAPGVTPPAATAPAGTAPANPVAPTPAPPPSSNTPGPFAR